MRKESLNLVDYQLEPGIINHNLFQSMRYYKEIRKYLIKIMANNMYFEILKKIAFNGIIMYIFSM